MLEIKKKLTQLREPIQVGIVGGGYMGSGLLNCITQMKMMEVVGLYDEDVPLAQETQTQYGTPRCKVYTDLEELCALSEVEVIVDATTSPLIGALTIQNCLYYGKHLISLNIECDATIGSLAAYLFRKKGLIYTVTAGDEPGELKKFYDHFTFLNFKVIALGKGKNNPLRVEANPQTVQSSLPNNSITARQVASFVDGSKTMLEMASISNATGLIPDIRGMHGVEASPEELPHLFQLKEKGGILNQEGVVDYITGDTLSGGVFIVVTIENERLRSDLAYIKVGNGPNYCYYQRYHNWFIDTPLSIAKLVLYNEPTVSPLLPPSSEVLAVAKKDLKKGESLDGIGGFTTYGIIERRDIAKEEGLFPLGLTEKAIMTRNVRKGEILTWEDVQLEESSPLVKMRKEQEDLETNYRRG